MFFYFGYLYKLFSWNEKLAKYKVWLVPVLFLIVVTAVVVMRPQVISVITNGSVPVYQSVQGAFVGIAGMKGLPLLQYFLYALVGVCGIAMVLLLSQFKGVADVKVLKTLGKYSLHIMCLHFLTFKIVSLIIIWVYHMPIERLAEYPVINDVNGLWWIAYTVSGCLVPVLAVKLFEIVKCKIGSLHGKRAKV